MKLKHMIYLTVICQLLGCVFYRHDINTQTGYNSRTYWSFLKVIDIGLDPNGLNISSDSKNIKAITPYGIMETSNVRKESENDNTPK